MKSANTVRLTSIGVGEHSSLNVEGVDERSSLNVEGVGDVFAKTEPELYTYFYS